MGVTVNVLHTGGTDVADNGWGSGTISPKAGSLVVAVVALYDAANYYGGIIADPNYDLGQVWYDLGSRGYTSSLGFVGAIWTIMDSDQSDQLILHEVGYNNYDAVAKVIVEFVPTANERFSFAQRLPVTYDTAPADRGTNDTFTAGALDALQPRNLVIGYSGAYNTGSEALTFSNSSPWTVAAQRTNNAGSTKEIACALYYAIDTTDTTFTSVVSAASDRHFIGSAEFKRERPITPVVSFVHD